MKTSKMLMLATIFSFAVAGMGIAAVRSASAQTASGYQAAVGAAAGSGTQTSGDKTTTKKTYNSGESTTGYTKANPCCDAGGSPKNWAPGLEQGGGKK
jgi:hypothetical protein